MLLTAKPCSENCPEITGRPFGSMRYCPKTQKARHEDFTSGEHGGKQYLERGVDGVWTQYDWRTGTRTPFEWKDGQPDPVIPPHPDETDCCADFGCCAEQIAGSGLAHIFAAIVDSDSEDGSAIISVVDAPPRGDA